MIGRRNWFVWWSIAAVLLIGLLVVGGFAVHRLGWSQGYAAAELAAQGAEAPTPPLAPPGWRPIGFSRGGFLLISLVLGLVLFAFVGKLLRMLVWGAVAGPAMCRSTVGGSWRHPRHWMHGPVPSWYSPWCEEPGERSQGRDAGANVES